MNEIQLFGPLPQVTLFAGQNNVGKSNVLHFIRDLHQATTFTLQDSDRAKFEGADRVLSARPVRLFESLIFENSLDLAHSQQQQAMAHLLTSPALRGPGVQTQWLRYEAPYPAAQEIQAGWQLSQAQIDEMLTGAYAGWERDLGDLCLSLLHQNSGNPAENVRQLLTQMAGQPPKPTVVYVPTQRRLTADGEVDYASGTGVLSRLADWQVPDEGREAEHRYFRALQGFVRRILADDAAVVQVPRSLSDLFIETDDRRLPARLLGAGLSQAIMLAAAAITHSQTLFLVEEPEANLHPKLQRELLTFLQSTPNQFIIATHSATLLDAAEGSAIFHLQLDASRATVAAVCPQPEHVRQVCHDLGYRASELLQANCVLWVEGPSDRIYLLHWLAQLAPKFRENRDFAVMFYGGSLLRHLDASDEQVDNFISLRWLNRFHAVLIDSDRGKEDDDLGEAKQRVIRQLHEPNTESFSWVTPGRTIENLVPAPLLDAAVKKVHPKLHDHWTAPTDQFGQPLKFERGGPLKVEIALRVCESWKAADFPPEVRDLVLNKVVPLIDESAATSERMPVK